MAKGVSSIGHRHTAADLTPFLEGSATISGDWTFSGALTLSSTLAVASNTVLAADSYPHLQVKDNTTGAAGTYIKLGVDDAGTAGAVGTTQSGDSGLQYQTYLAYEMAWDDDNDNWTAFRTNLGRKSALLLGYHVGGLKYIYQTASFTTSATSSFTELLHINGESSKTFLNTSLAIPDGITAPSTSSGWAQIYVDTSDGDLKVKFGDGTVKTIATDT